MTNFALVLDSAWTLNGLRRGGQVEILMADGTHGTYDIDWDDSADAMDSVDMGKITDSDVKLENYLGTRDVNQPDGETYHETGMAKGSLITYTLDDNDVLTIERVYQGNQFESDNSIEIAENTKKTKTANVGDDGTIVYMADLDRPTYQYVSAEKIDNAYTSGRGSIKVRGFNINDTKTYAIDRNTIAFYYDGEDYAVATGWQNMEDMPAEVTIQVYPALEKAANGVYEATNLAEVIIFSEVPNVTSNDYMLVLNRNAYTASDELWLNVVFEDGTVAEIQVDDIDGDSIRDKKVGGYPDFKDFEDNDDFMKAYPYVENADGTYDIVRGEVKFTGAAELYRNGTVAFAEGDDNDDDELDGYVDYIAYDPDDTNIWDVTGVDSANDEVVAGDFTRNLVVNTVVVEDKDEIRTAWIWDVTEVADEKPEENEDYTLTIDSFTANKVISTKTDVALTLEDEDGKPVTADMDYTYTVEILDSGKWVEAMTGDGKVEFDDDGKATITINYDYNNRANAGRVTVTVKDRTIGTVSDMQSFG